MNGVCLGYTASSRGILAILFPSAAPSSSRLSTAFFHAHTPRPSSSSCAAISWREANVCNGIPHTLAPPSWLQQLLRTGKDAATLSWPPAQPSIAHRPQPPSHAAAARSSPLLNHYSHLFSGHVVLSRLSRSPPPAVERPTRPTEPPTPPPLPPQPPREKDPPPPPPPPPTEPPEEDPPPPAPPPQNSAAPPPPPPPAQPHTSTPQSSSGAPQGGCGAERQGGGAVSDSLIVSQSNRPSTPPLVYGLIAVNVGIFFLWKYAIHDEDANGEPAWLILMINNFLHGQRNWDAGRPWNILTATFSHFTLQHLALNMLCLALLGPLATAIGSTTFLGVYILGGVAGCLASSLNFLYLEPRLRPNENRSAEAYSTLGASGSIFALLTVAAALQNPSQPFFLRFRIPCSATVLMAWLTANELAGIYFGKDLLGHVFAENVDHAAHMGGILSGFVFWAWKLRRGGAGAGAVAGGRMRWK